MTEKPHILFTNKKRQWGGEPAMVCELAKGFARRGYRVTLATNPGSEAEKRADREAGVSVWPLPLLKDRPAVLWTMPRTARALARFVREQSVALVHTTASFDTWLAALGLATARLKVPLVRTKHNLKPIGRSPHNRWYYRRGVTHFIAPSQAVYDHLMASGLVPPERVTYVANGIPLEGHARFEGTRAEARQALDLPQDAEVIAYVSRLSDRKDPATLWRAVLSLAERRPVKLIVAGFGLGKVLRPLRELAGDSDAITMLGFREDVGRILKAADVYCLPSLNEPFGLAPLEAMLNRVPVVLSDCAGFQDYLRDGENGLAFPAGDHVALAAALERMLSDPELRARCADEGERTVRDRFNAERMVADTEAVYQNLIARASA